MQQLKFMQHKAIANDQLQAALKVTLFEYEELKRLGLSLIERFSEPWPVFFIGVGRSPTPLMAFLEAYLGKSYVATLPLSGFRHNYLGENIPLLREPLSVEQLDALFQHFRRFIPSGNLKSTTQLVLIDFVDSGASLAAVSHYLDKYLQVERIQYHLSAAALWTDGMPACFVDTMNELQLNYADISIHSNSNSRSCQNFRLGRGSYYDCISPFNQSFKIADGSRTEILIEDRRLYSNYISQLVNYMLNDPQVETPLQGAIQTLFKKSSVAKYCASISDAKKLLQLFNSFPFHVPAKLIKDRVIYDFIAGDTLEYQVLMKHENSVKLIKDLAHTLGELHWNHAIIIHNYQKVCEKREICKNLVTNPDIYGYFTQIHGDLHFRNILATQDGQLIFIDRMRQCGDLMYDFPFILSLLCFTKESNDYFFLDLLRAFFSVYETYVDDKDNFYCAFLTNFINYAWIAQATYKNSTPIFFEWKRSAELSHAAYNYTDFRDFVNSEFTSPASS